jgi:transposase
VQAWKCKKRAATKEKAMAIVFVGIDLAKSIFAIHGVDECGKATLVKPKVQRDELAKLIANLPACTIAMEACSGAHHWARVFASFGHTVKLIAPKFVVPYRRSGKKGKNDAADAAAICEAGQRPDMRFVPVKDVEQQGILCVHRVRQGFVEERTAVINRLRGLLSEFGIVMNQRASVVREKGRDAIERLTGYAKTAVSDLLEEMRRLDQKILDYDKLISEVAKNNSRAANIKRIKGVGSVTASLVVSLIGNGHDFKSGRQFSAWIGLTPSQYSSGGKSRLGRITKAGDPYLRSLLILGARAVLNSAKGKTDEVSKWACGVQERRGYWRAIVAIASKNARMIWAALRKGEGFQVPA